MIEEINSRNQTAFEFLKLLYKYTVGNNDRMKQVPIAKIAYELGLYSSFDSESEIPDHQRNITEDEKDKLWKEGMEAREITRRLSENSYIELLGKPHPYHGSYVRITWTGIQYVEKTITKQDMTDNELRGMVLKKFYSLRKEDYITVNQKIFDMADLQEIFRISEQLYENNLIELKTLRGDDKIVSAKGKITSSGVDVVEQDGKNSPIQLTFINTQIIHNKNDEKVEEMLQILKLLRDQSDTKESLAQKANAIIQLQPNFAGFGININEIIRRLWNEK